MDKKCEICGDDIYNYNTKIIEYNGKHITSCTKCNTKFKLLIEGDSKDIEESKNYFSSLEYGRLYSEIQVNDYIVHYIKSRDNFNAEDLKTISDNLLKSNQQDNTFYSRIGEEAKVLHIISDNIAYIKKVMKFFYYLAIISLSTSALYVFIWLMTKLL